MSCLEVLDLHFAYPGHRNILELEGFKLEQGDRAFIYGPSGCGKSTLLNLLAGVLVPTQGQLKLLNQEFGSLSLRQRDRFRGDHIGLIFQSFNLIPYLSIEENIKLPYFASSLRQKKIKSLAQEVSHLVERLGLAPFLKQRASSLSLGQQQRVAVGRALIGSPEIIIADEPTSSLDDQSTESFMQLLLEQQKESNSTLIFVSHDLRLKKYFTTAHSLNDLNQIKGGQDV